VAFVIIRAAKASVGVRTVVWPLCSSGQPKPVWGSGLLCGLCDHQSSQGQSGGQDCCVALVIIRAAKTSAGREVGCSMAFVMARAAQVNGVAIRAAMVCVGCWGR